MSLLKREKTEKSIVASLFLIISVLFLYILFRNLGTSSVINYDEARHGISAYEMLKTGNWIENTFVYEKDLWNLKPPLSFWLEAGAMKLFGNTVFAFRFPSALSLLLLFFMVSGFLYKTYGKASAICFMVLFTAFDDFFFAHLGRSGDADALYILCYFASLLCVFRFCRKNGKKSSLYFGAFFAALAFLTKSFHAASLYLSIVLCLFAGRKQRKTNWKTLLIAAGWAAVPVLLWAVWRYSYDGLTFLGSMFSTDVTDRVEGYNKDIHTYLQWMGTIVFYWMPRMFAAVLLSGISVLLLNRKNDGKEKTGDSLFWGISLICAFVPFLISFAKINWYFFPFKVLLCITAAIVFGEALPEATKIIQSDKGAMKKSYCCLVMFLWVAVFGYSCLNIVRNVHKADSLGMDPIQQALIELPGSEAPEYDGRTCFVMRSDPREGEPENWEQADILVAELYHDYYCKHGGVPAFLETPGAVLYITKDLIPNDESLAECKQIGENDRYAVFASDAAETDSGT